MKIPKFGVDFSIDIQSRKWKWRPRFRISRLIDRKHWPRFALMGHIRWGWVYAEYDFEFYRKLEEDAK